MTLTNWPCTVYLFWYGNGIEQDIEPGIDSNFITDQESEPY